MLIAEIFPFARLNNLEDLLAPFRYSFYTNDIIHLNENIQEYPLNDRFVVNLDNKIYSPFPDEYEEDDNQFADHLVPRLDIPMSKYVDHLPK